MGSEVREMGVTWKAVEGDTYEGYVEGGARIWDGWKESYGEHGAVWRRETSFGWQCEGVVSAEKCKGG